MEMSGWIALHRKFTEWGWYQDPATKVVFIHLLLIARWNDGEWKGVKLRRGECVIGRRKLAKKLGLSEKQVRTALKHLEDSGEITRKKVKIRANQRANVLTLVKVNNFNGYQDIGMEPGANQRAEQGPQLNKDNNINIKDTLYISELVGYLNEKTGKRYRQTAATKAALNGLLDAGYTPEDVKRVIDKKTGDWMGTKFEAGLAPRSLFDADKFDAYLNESISVTKEDRRQLISELAGLQIKFNEVGLTAEEQRRMEQLEEELNGSART